MRCLQICCLVFLLLLPVTSFSSTFEKEFSFQEVEILQQEEFHQVTIPGLMTNGDPGNPQLPFYAIRMLLPSGEELLNVQIIEGNWITVATDIRPVPGSQLYPISRMEKPEELILSAIYDQDTIFPEIVLDGIRTDFLKGYGIGQAILHPVRWNPVDGSLEQLTSVRVAIETTPTPRAEASLELLRSDRNTRNELEALSIDISQLSTYTSLDELDELDTRFVIICDEALSAAWQSYADFKTRRGMKTEVITTQDIYSNYQGQDNQEKIRNAITVYFGSGLDYVLLGGDVNHIPYRGLYATAGSEEDTNIPADIYYAALDGNWNTDDDNLWGEANEADLFQEVSIGRASVTDVAMVYSWIAKQISYQTEPVINEVTNGLMVGEDLGWTPWGGDYKDEIRLGSSNHGYTTEGFPASWTVGTLYDMDDIWNISQLFDRLNNGVHYVNHLGHCYVEYGLKAVNSDITDNNLTNNGENHSYYLLYTQGCYCGAFEQSSIMEKWNTINHGAFAVIANSRYGWGSGSNTDGPSQYYDREFFDAIFAENITRVGDVNRDSKHDNVVNIDGSCMRWCYYQLNLFGDPSVELYTDTIQDLEVNFPAVAILGSEGITITSTSDVPYRVAVSRNNELLGVGVSNGAGEAFIELELIEPGMLDVVVTALNAVPIETQIPTVAPTGVYPVVNNVFIHDIDNGATANGQADFGESFQLGIEFKNVGVEDIETLDVQIGSDSEQLTLDGTAQQLLSITTNGVDTLYFDTQVDLMVNDLDNISFSVHMVVGEDEWDQECEITTHAPILSFAIVGINDEATGNGNHRLDPGETASVIIEYVNQGSADLFDAQLTITEENEYLTVVEGDPVYETVLAGETVLSTAFLDISVNEACVNPSRAFLTTHVGFAETDYMHNNTTYINIGGIFNDVETGQEWEHYSQNEIADSWHIDHYRNSTPRGSSSYKAGGEGAAEYDNDMDNCIEIPTFAIDSEVVLSFYHYMSAEISTQYSGQCYDGGRVEYSEDNGTTWAPVMMPGYNYVTRGEGPIGVGASVYSGSIEWAFDSVIIHSDADSIKIRFRFFSDGGISMEGWYIDDISIAASWGATPPCNLNGEIVEDILNLTWSMPEGLPDEALPVAYMVYRDGGLVSTALTELLFQDDMSALDYGSYYYTVAAIYNDGPSEPSEPLEVIWELNSAGDLSSLPTSWEISQPYPNPFNPSFAVKISLPSNAAVTARLFNVLGQNVYTKNAGRLASGYHTLNFDNMSLSSGIYFLTVKAGPEARTFKVVMMK